jgi:hypothetical protein
MITPEEVYDATLETLQWWLDLHTDAETWAEDLLSSLFPEQYWERVTDGSWLSWGGVNLTTQVIDGTYKAVAERWIGEMAKCRECGCIYHCTEECRHDERRDDMAEDEYVTDLDELARYYKSMQVEPEPDDVIKGLIEGVFPVYRDWVSAHTCAIEDEVREAIEGMKSAYGQDKAVELLKALGIDHAFNDRGLVTDYCTYVTDIPPRIFNRIRTEGLLDVFDKWELKEWLE